MAPAFFVCVSSIHIQRHPWNIWRTGWQIAQSFRYLLFHVSLYVFLIRMQSRSDRAVASEQAAAGTSMRGGRLSYPGQRTIIHPPWQKEHRTNGMLQGSLPVTHNSLAIFSSFVWWEETGWLGFHQIFNFWSTQGGVKGSLVSSGDRGQIETFLWRR